MGWGWGWTHGEGVWVEVGVGVVRIVGDVAAVVDDVAAGVVTAAVVLLAVALVGVRSCHRPPRTRIHTRYPDFRDQSLAGPPPISYVSSQT